MKSYLTLIYYLHPLNIKHLIRLPHHYICDKRLRLRQQMLEAEDMSVNVVKM